MKVDWPGWPLLTNEYGNEFDEAARKRMVIGGRQLIPFILKYKHRLGNYFLEIGPFFNPILVSKEINSVVSKNSFIHFLENDPNVINWLRSNFSAKVTSIDFNRGDLKSKLRSMVLDERGRTKFHFDTVLISQVLNYVDFRFLLEGISSLIKPGSLVFINNVINYGLPSLFSPQRPLNNDDLIAGAEAKGFSVVEKCILPQKDYRNQTLDRLILVLEKKQINDL